MSVASRKQSLLSQQEYASRIGVSPSWVSKATKEMKVVNGQYYPAQDAVLGSGGTLIGYEDPTTVEVASGSPSAANAALPGTPSSNGQRSGRRSSSAGEHARTEAPASKSGNGDGTPSPNGSSFRSGAGGGGSAERTGTNARENPSSSRRTPQQNSKTDENLEEAATALTKALARDPETFHHATKVGTTLGTAGLFWKLGEEDLPSALLGGAIGFGLAEYFLR